MIVWRSIILDWRFSKLTAWMSTTRSSGQPAALNVSRLGMVLRCWQVQCLDCCLRQQNVLAFSLLVCSTHLIQQTSLLLFPVVVNQWWSSLLQWQHLPTSLSDWLITKCSPRQFSPLTYQPVYVDMPSLTNSVTSILSLGIHGRNPVRVIETHSISSCQVNSYTTTMCGQYHHKDHAVSVESVHQMLPHHYLGCTI